MDSGSISLDEPNVTKAEHIPEELVEEFRETFSLLDKDGDGLIKIDELVHTLLSLGETSTPMELDEMVHEFDANGDGLIDFDEFKQLMYQRMKSTDGEGDIKKVFQCLDMNRRGYFTAVELYRVTVVLGENVSVEEIQELINNTKTEQPGKVNYREFCHLVKVLIGRQ